MSCGPCSIPFQPNFSLWQFLQEENSLKLGSKTPSWIDGGHRSYAPLKKPVICPCFYLGCGEADSDHVLYLNLHYLEDSTYVDCEGEGLVFCPGIPDQCPFLLSPHQLGLISHQFWRFCSGPAAAGSPITNNIRPGQWEGSSQGREACSSGPGISGGKASLGKASGLLLTWHLLCSFRFVSLCQWITLLMWLAKANRSKKRNWLRTALNSEESYENTHQY